ncbi:MAG TPA: hypothetical protein VF618_25395 [Thermoanaerobaculia bacterium]
MPLIDAVAAACTRLAPRGWDRLMRRHGLNLKAADLRAELAKPLTVNRNLAGFEDFAAEGVRGIEPGQPARSLLYHAFASPNVLTDSGVRLKDFPTLAEIEAVENYVFGVEPPSIQELTALANGNLMALVVFTTEYRPAVDTPLRKHADLCFSRSGVARVGTAPALYEPASRGFTPKVKGKPHAIRVLPARYSVWIAAQRKGNQATFGPMTRFPLSDQERDFWVPIHKLFSGNECIHEFDLDVDLFAHHVNEKLRRVHLVLGARGHDTGWTRPEIDNPPFRFTDGIAELVQGLVVPVPHAQLVEPAKKADGTPLTFRVPPTPGPPNILTPSFEIPSVEGARPAPEYVHVRHAPAENPPNLNDLPDVSARMMAGGYEAQHYLDFTGDGWVEPVCPELAAEFPRFISAYSIVAAPDFYFLCDQRELMHWWDNKAPSALRSFLWETEPETLADTRLAPNLKLNNVDFQAGNTALPIAGFRPEDTTVTAIVSIAARGSLQERPLRNTARARHTQLPDGAAGVFAPGWDTSFDRTGSVMHLSAYGLGSPFPEDSKLCAALSTFWPSVSPDAARTFSPARPNRVFATVSPMTDEEIGSAGNLPWDGVKGPRVVQSNGVEVVEYASYEHVDYVESALADRFTLELTSAVDTHQYTARVVAMARAYRAIGVTSSRQKGEWQIISFRSIAATSKDVKAAKSDTGVQLGGPIFRFDLYQPVLVAAQPTNHRLRHLGISNRTFLLVGGNREIMVKQGAAPAWRIVNVPIN